VVTPESDRETTECVLEHPDFNVRGPGLVRRVDLDPVVGSNAPLDPLDHPETVEFELDKWQLLELDGRIDSPERIDQALIRHVNHLAGRENDLDLGFAARHGEARHHVVERNDLLFLIVSLEWTDLRKCRCRRHVYRPRRASGLSKKHKTPIPFGTSISEIRAKVKVFDRCLTGVWHLDIERPTLYILEKKPYANGMTIIKLKKCQKN